MKNAHYISARLQSGSAAGSGGADQPARRNADALSVPTRAHAASSSSNSQLAPSSAADAQGIPTHAHAVARSGSAGQPARRSASILSTQRARKPQLGAAV